MLVSAPTATPPSTNRPWVARVSGIDHHRRASAPLPTASHARPIPAGMAFYKDPTLDPYLQGDKAGASDSDSETEAMTLQKNDLLIMAARNEDDVSHLEVRAGRPRPDHRRGRRLDCACAGLPRPQAPLHQRPFPHSPSG